MKFEQRYICDIKTFDEYWEVIMKSQPDMSDVDGATFRGLTVYENHEIHICNNLDEWNLKSTVYHEVAHAFIHSLANHQSEFTNEEVCDLIGRYGSHIHEQAQKVLNEIEKMKL